MRSKEVICVNYLDDFLIFGESLGDCKQKILFTIDILKSLGFVINWEKSSINPSTTCKFLGFVFHTDTLKIELPYDKRTKIHQCILLIQNKKVLKIREFAQFLGLLISACPAIKYGFLYTKALEREKLTALRKNNMNFDAKMTISLNFDLSWWRDNIKTACNDIKQDSFELEIFTDSSLSGWGACCNGEKTHGWWTLEDKRYHINFLELQAIFLGLKCFAKNLKNCNILIRCDNTTAIACVDRMGSVQYKHLNTMARILWQWCEQRNIWIFASYVNTKDNWEADSESRILKPETEWSLANYAFAQIKNKFGNPEVDLFASRNNYKCPKYVSWLRDPEALSCDAFTICWSNIYFYSFPPFAIILRVLQKIIKDKAEGILVVPYWPSQWFPLFMKLSLEKPIRFTPDPNLLLCPFSQECHPLWANLTLVASRLSGNL